jgi:hypothetical protein
MVMVTVVMLMVTVGLVVTMGHVMSPVGKSRSSSTPS